jgi:trimeric autotransporter adhesin
MYKSFIRLALSVAAACTVSTSMAQVIPATMYGLAGTNLITINSETPGATLPGVTITGIPAGFRILSIDSRPSTGQLYGLAYNAVAAQGMLYIIEPVTGVATRVGSGAPLPMSLDPSGTAIDFNPVVDRLRVVSRNRVNFVLSPQFGSIFAINTPLNYPGQATAPSISTMAYTNSFPGATSTITYVVDDLARALGILEPQAAGSITPVIQNSILDQNFQDLDVGYDFATQQNFAYAVTSVNGVNSLLTFDASAAVNGSGFVSRGTIPTTAVVSDIAIKIQGIALPPILGKEVFALGVNNNTLYTFDSEFPSVIRTQLTIIGVPNSQLIAGMDIRPATGQIYILGYNRGASQARLYTVNKMTGVATPVGTTAVTVNLGSTRNIGLDFNPVVDRVRIVSTNNANIRLNPITGDLVSADAMLKYAVGDRNAFRNPAAGAAAYTNSFAGTTSTLLYDYDDSTNALVTQVPPNDGVLNTVGFSGYFFATADGGVDIDIAYDARTATNMAFATGRPNRDTRYSFYNVDLMTGRFNLVGPLSVPVRDIAIMSDAPSNTGGTTPAPSLTGIRINVSPNPATGPEINVSFEAIAQLNYDVVIMDSYGTILRQLPIGTAGPGTVSADLNTTGLASGLYSVMVRGNGRIVGQTRIVR